MSAISDHLDTHVNRQVRQALDPLARMADRTGCIVGGIAHFNKSSGTDASSLITATGAFKDVARYIFAFATDEEDGSRSSPRPKTASAAATCHRSPTASSRPRCRPPKATPALAGSSSTAQTDRSVRDILERPGRRRARREGRAEDYLREALADGPRATKDVRRRRGKPRG